MKRFVLTLNYEEIHYYRIVENLETKFFSYIDVRSYVRRYVRVVV